jgi:glycosyltransferase involved in cell wall biosynthesis
MMKISIVTPSLNQGRYLAEALESVRAQGHTGVEHLVLDGGSTDETISLLQSLDGHKEWRYLNWISGPDGGQSEALNRGFGEVTGEIVGWLNSDDRYRPGCFDHVVKAFAENPEVDVFYGDFAMVDQDGAVARVRREIEFSRFILLYHRVSYIPTPSTFFRRRVFDDGNRLQPSLHYAMDYEFFLRLADAGYTIRHIPEVLADFRLHPESKSCSRELVQAQEKRRIMWAVSPISRRIGSPLLQRAAFFGLRWFASLMRYSEKMLRGYYFGGLFRRGEGNAGLPPAA